MPILTFEADLDKAMAIAPVRSEVQTVSIGGSVAPTGGNLTLTYAGQTTGNIAWNANAGAVQTALRALSNIADDEVVCSGGPFPGTPVICTFAAGLGNENVALMTGSAAGLTGGTGNTIVVAETIKGYGAEKDAINAGIDAFATIASDQLIAAGQGEIEQELVLEALLKLGETCAVILRDQVS